MTQELLTREQMRELATRDLEAIAELVGTAESLTIETNEQYTAADELLARLKGANKTSEEHRAEAKKPFLDGGRAVDAAWAEAKSAYEQGEGVIRKAMLAFRRKRQEEAERAAALQRQREDQERQKRLEQAQRAEERGQARKAETLREQAMTAPVAHVEASIPESKNTHFRTAQRWEIVDKAQIKPDFMAPDEAAIDALVGRVGARAVEIVGGIRVWEEEVPVTRAQR